MSEYQLRECPQHGYYAAELGACPRCGWIAPQPPTATTGSVQLYSITAQPMPHGYDVGITRVVTEPKQESPLESDFMDAWALTGLEMPQREYRFDTNRRWRFDMAWPDKKLAVEMEGGLYGYGRHNRAGGYIADLQKYNAAVEQGWLVLRYHQVTPEAIEQVRRVFLKK